MKTLLSFHLPPLDRGGWATTTLATILFLLSATFSLTLLRNKLTGAVTYTGDATITGVTITKLGTGQTVTYDDGSTLTADTSKYEVLNNDEVVYKASYNVTKAGTVALSITMPANNTINEATIASANGCADGSKLETVEVNGEKSYTNNKATCIIDTTKAGTWNISTNPWGGNGAQITPTFTVNDAEQQNINTQPVITVGKLQYKIRMAGNYRTQGSGGFDQSTGFGFWMYTPKTSTGVLGIAPINSISFNVDMSQMPAGWEVYKYDTGNFCNGVDRIDTRCTANSGNISWVKNDDTKLIVTVDNMTTAVMKYPSDDVDNHDLPNLYGMNVWSSYRVFFNIPLSSLPNDPTNFKLAFGDVVSNDGYVINNVKRNTYTYTLDNNIEVETYRLTLYPTNSFPRMPGWDNAWNHDARYPLYVGEKLSIAYGVDRIARSGDDMLHNVYVCQTFDPNQLSLSEPTDSTVSGLLVEYGVISVDNLPSPSQSSCGKYGDKVENFFGDLTLAQQYADKQGLKVNAVRGYVKQIGANSVINRSVSRVVGKSPNNGNSSAMAIAADKLSEQSEAFRYNVTPGIFSATTTAVPSDTSPNTEDNITITPRTYNRDTNAQIIVDLPSGLTPKQGTFYRDLNNNNTMDQGEELTLGKDYTINPLTAGSNTTTITFNLGAIGSEPTVGEDGLPIASDGSKDSNGLPTGIVQPSIKFTTNVASDVPTPSTLTITTKTTGDGTKYASKSFRTSTAKVNVATREEFGYNLTTNANTIYASDDLTYNLSNYNMLDKDVNNLTTINVLPYNGDDRGTARLNSYSLKDIKLTATGQNNSTIDTSDLKLYYATDEKARTNPADSSIKWEDASELLSSAKSSATFLNPTALVNSGTSPKRGGEDGAKGSQEDEVNVEAEDVGSTNNDNRTVISLPLTGRADERSSSGEVKGITALKLTKSTMPKGSTINLSYTMTDIDMDGPTSTIKPTIGNDIAHISSTALDNPVTNVARTDTQYLGNLLTLSLDKSELTIDKLNTQTIDTSLSNTVTATTKTKNGYNLTISPATESGNGTTTSLLGTKTVSNGKKLELPTLATGQTLNKNTAAWAVKGGNLTNWTGFASPTQSLTLHTNTTGGAETTAISTTFAISSGNVRADTYKGAVRYTLTAEPKV